MIRHAFIAQLLLVVLGSLNVLLGIFSDDSNWLYMQSTVYIAASLIVFGLSGEE